MRCLFLLRGIDVGGHNRRYTLRDRRRGWFARRSWSMS